MDLLTGFNRMVGVLVKLFQSIKDKDFLRIAH